MSAEAKAEFNEYGLKSITQKHAKRINPVAFRVKQNLGTKFHMLNPVPREKGGLKKEGVMSIFIHNSKKTADELVAELINPILVVRRYPGLKNLAIELNGGNRFGSYNAEEVKKIWGMVETQLKQRGISFTKEEVNGRLTMLLTGKLRNPYSHFPYHR